MNTATNSKACASCLKNDTGTASWSSRPCSAASLYTDQMFAKAGFSLVDGTNSFTAIATDSTPASVTNLVTTWLPATAVFQYDSNGNMLSDGLRACAYDDENQLTSVLVTNAWKSEFTYDGKMRRRIRKEYSWTGSTWEQTNEVRYVYDGNLVLQERDSDNTPRVTYTRGKDLSGSLEGAGGIGGLLARSAISESPSPITTHAFYHADGNGNITALINPQQAIAARYHYDPYGNLLAKSGSLADANLYRFSSKETHTPSGLVYYLYRYYAPDLQRWVNRDPIQEKGGRNLYRFVQNGPIIWSDGFGHSINDPPPCAPYPDCLTRRPPPNPWSCCSRSACMRAANQSASTCRAAVGSVCAGICVFAGPAGFMECYAPCVLGGLSGCVVAQAINLARCQSCPNP